MLNACSLTVIVIKRGYDIEVIHMIIRIGESEVIDDDNYDSNDRHCKDSNNDHEITQ